MIGDGGANAVGRFSSLGLRGVLHAIDDGLPAMQFQPRHVFAFFIEITAACGDAAETFDPQLRAAVVITVALDDRHPRHV